VLVDGDLGRRAMVPLQRMLDFASELQLSTRGSA
jgi:translation elongation factor EF-G